MSKILNIYLYGSYVYGTNDQESDTDYIVVTDYQEKKEDQLFAGFLNLTSHPFAFFQSKVDEHRVSALECIFLPERLKIELAPPSFNLDLEKLRRSFSEKSSNSWVKAKKKIELHEEHRIGRKSLFHSMRILVFGIQIATHGRIVDYNAANWIWEKIQTQNYMEWEKFKEYWQPHYNQMRSKFRECAPIKKD